MPGASLGIVNGKAGDLCLIMIQVFRLERRALANLRTFSAQLHETAFSEYASPHRLPAFLQYEIQNLKYSE
jgi:hypothetical protein